MFICDFAHIKHSVKWVMSEVCYNFAFQKKSCYDQNRSNERQPWQACRAGV